jgi:hypothetical protein
MIGATSLPLPPASTIPREETAPGGRKVSREPLYRLAARQNALFTRRQAAGVGVSGKEVEGGVRSGAWERVYQGVYRMAGAPITDLQALHSAVLAGGPPALASHRGAAWLWGRRPRVLTSPGDDPV